MIAVYSLSSVESLGSACVKNFEFSDKRFILLVPRWDCKSNPPNPNLEALLMA